MIRRSPVMGAALATAVVACVLLAGCSNEKASWLDWKASPPDNPGTAEQLVGTSWDFGPNAIAFDADGKCRMGAQGGVLIERPDASWSIDNGIVTVKDSNGTLVTATWDGENLVANGFVATPSGTEE